MMRNSKNQGIRLALMAAASVGSLTLAASASAAESGSESAGVDKPGSLEISPTGAPDAQTAGREAGVGDIIVTATRRETSLQKTPQAISVLTGDDQFARGQTRLQDLQTTVPNLTFAATNNNAQYFIRGIGTSFLGAGGDPGVAVYQDGAYVSDQTTSNTSFFDVQRVEVLRGPQGALYGRNAVGGAILILSAQPTPDWKGFVSATGGSYGRLESEGFLSGPLGFADTDMRASYQIKHRNGYITNTAPPAAGGPRDFNDLESQAFRFQTLTSLPGDGTLKLLFSYYNQSDHGDALTVIPTPGFVYPSQLLFGVAPGNDPRNVQANAGLFKIRTYTGNATYVQPIGSTELTMTGNYRHSKQLFENDCDGTSIGLCSFDRATSGSDYFFDGHLASSGTGPLRWIIGGTYSHFKQDQLNLISGSFPLSYLAPGAPSNIPFAFDVTSGGTVTTKSYAFYLDLKYQLSDIWAVTGQARYNRTTRDATEISIIPQFGVNVPAFPNALRNSFFPFKFGVEAQLSPTALVYGSYATAYKDGAINLGSLQTLPVRPERAESFEAGFKTSLMDRKIRLNGAVFKSQYTDLQIQRVLTAVTVLSNVPRSTIFGAELEFVVEPVPGLQFSVNAGYLNAKFKEFSNSPNVPGLAPGPVQNVAGNKLPYIAPYSISVRADYSFEPISGYEGKLGIDYSARGRAYFNEFSDGYNSQAPVGTLNLTASVGQQDGGWKAFFYMNNVTDRTIMSSSTIYAGTLGASRAVSYAPPRNWGAGLSFAF